MRAVVLLLLIVVAVVCSDGSPTAADATALAAHPQQHPLYASSPPSVPAPVATAALPSSPSSFPSIAGTSAAPVAPLRIPSSSSSSITSSSLPVAAASSAPTTGSSLCGTSSSKGVFDFSGLARPGGYLFMTLWGDTILYNFCDGVSVDFASNCTSPNTAVCDIWGTRTQPVAESLGTLSSASWTVSSDSKSPAVIASYSGGTRGTRSFIYFVCDASKTVPEITQVDEPFTTLTVIVISTVCACPNGCLGGVPTPTAYVAPLCQFQAPNGAIYDFTSLQSAVGLTANAGVQQLTYNFCDAISCGAYSNTAVCASTNGIGPASCGELSAYNVSQASDAGLTITYTSGAGGRSSVVLLICDLTALSPVVTTRGETLQKHYEMTVRSQCACPDQCVEQPNKKQGGLTSGDRAAIALGILLLVVTIVSAVLLNIRKRRAQRRFNDLAMANTGPGYERLLDD